MRLSVCIVNWNTREYLRECLTALRQYPSVGAEMEVIVVDNASADGSAAMVASEFPSVSLIGNSDNKGYAEGNNQALERASGDFLLLLNPDVVVYPDSLTRALQFMAAHPEAGALGCRLVGMDGETQRSVRGFPDPGPVLWDARSRVFGAYRMTFFDYDRVSEVDQPMGSFLLLTRAALDRVGLMDPQFPIFFNEVDWCWRAKREQGFHIYYTPDAVVTHYGGSSTRQVKAAMVRESHRSLLRFYDKHYARLVPPVRGLIRLSVLLNEWRLTRRAKV